MEMFPLVSALTDSNGAVIKSSGMSLDGVLNVLIPISIFFVFGFLIYKNFTREIDALIGWIRRQFEEAKAKDQAVPINNPYMADGVIVYQ